MLSYSDVFVLYLFKLNKRTANLINDGEDTKDISQISH